MLIKIKYLYSLIPDGKYSNNSYYAKPKNHFWFPNWLMVHGQQGGGRQASMAHFYAR